jgi:hypothetical protein
MFTGMIREIRVRVPPIDLQQEFARRLAAVEKLKAAHRASLAQLDELLPPSSARPSEENCKMTHPTYELSFKGELLQRGFWLYVWEITTPEQERLYYVGRTGDSSSVNAQSPFNRMGQHLGFNENANVLRRHLIHKDRNVNPDACSFRLVAHGPMLQEAAGLDEHRARRDVVAALEKALADAMREAGYAVINRIDCRKHVDAALFSGVRAAFAAHFQALGSGTRTPETAP